MLTILHPFHANHNGGTLVFDASGNLYISTGDGGGTGDNAQSLGSLLGKILRIRPRQSGADDYTVPDNPFQGLQGARREIWAYGLRNPYRFSLDRQTGDLVIGDVGEASFEEVDFSRGRTAPEPAATSAGTPARGARSTRCRPNRRRARCPASRLTRDRLLRRRLQRHRRLRRA